ALLKAAPTQEEQLVYALHLRNIKSGWTTELRKDYFNWFAQGLGSAKHPDFAVQWFVDAGIRFSNGASFGNFMNKMHAEAKNMLDAGTQQELAEVLNAYTARDAKKVKKPKTPAVARKLVKEWTLADLTSVLEPAARGKDFELGKEVYEAAKCLACHKMGNGGGAIGPDLTTISTRFKRDNILESI